MELGINELDREEEDLLFSDTGDTTPPPAEPAPTPDPAQEPTGNTDIYDDDLTDPEPAPAGTSNEGDEEVDFIASILSYKGIADPSKIKYEDEDGNIQEVAWDTLSDEEKLNILTSSDEEPNEGLEQGEISLINEIRESDLTTEEWVNYIKQQAISDYVASLEDQQPQYEVDSFTDDELYVLDLRAKIPDLTEEEEQAALELAKSHENLYQKQVESLREEYRQIELNKTQEEAALRDAEEQEFQAQFESQVNDALSQLDSVGRFQLDLEDEDIEDIQTFIMGSDKAGVRWMQKALNDPETLVKMAWFVTKGDEALASIAEYYNNQITEVGDANYKKGYEDAKNGTTPSRQNKPKVVVKPKSNKSNNPNTKPVSSIDDLYTDID